MTFCPTTFEKALLAFCTLNVAVGGYACGQAAKTSAESAYTAQQLACVQDAGTRAESRACRKMVDERWGVDGGSQ